MTHPLPAEDPALYDQGVAEVDPVRAVAVATPACPVCGTTTATPRFTIEGLAVQLVVCRGCGTGRLHPMPSEAEVADFYPAHYYGDLGSKFRTPIEMLVRLVGARHVRFLAEGLAPGARVLDLGCGRGVLLSALADRGLEAHGVELNEAAARGADPRAQVRVAPTLPAAGYPGAWFDCAIVWHVLEHLRDPAGALAELARVLRPGGRLVVAVPNFASIQAKWAGPAWFHLDLPRHLHHFPLAALRRLLERHGFEVVSEHHFSLRQNPFGWLQSWLNRRTDLPRNGLYTLLYRRAAGAPPPFDPRTQRALWTGLALGAVPALAATAVETLLRSGGTVHVVARRRP
jgi:SAM-dependent methyltransferase